MIDLFRASKYARLHQGKVMVFKLGGACLAKPSGRAALARQISVASAFGVRAVIVHGAGPQTDEWQTLLGEAPRKVDGRRVTSEVGLRALRLASMGDVSGLLCASLDAEGAPAVGLCAASAQIVVGRRRSALETSEGPVDFGCVGDVEEVQPAPLEALSAAGFIPVVGSPAGDGQGGFLNINADCLASAIAVALGADKLILVSDTPGILSDASDRHSLLSSLSLAQLNELRQRGCLQDGMAVKAAAIASALEGGVPRVHVVSGLGPDALLGELYTTQGTGTLVTREAPDASPLASGFTELAQGSK